MQVSIVRVQCRRKETSRSLSHDEFLACDVVFYIKCHVVLHQFLCSAHV